MKTQAVATYKLPSGQTAIVDAEDAWLFERYRWHLGKGYAVTEVGSRSKGTRKVHQLHRLIMKPAEHENIDHKNCDPLDNRRSNLRLCNKSQNGMNRIAQANSQTGVKGVSPYRRYGRMKYRATITVARKTKHLGLFDTIEEAQKVYAQHAKELHGEFARC